MALFEDFEGRIPQVNKALKEYGFKEGEAGLNEARDLCKARGFDPYEICQSTQQICFEDAKWAYVLGSAIAIKEAEKTGDKTQDRFNSSRKHRKGTSGILSARFCS